MSDNPDTIDTILDDMLNEGHTGPADALEWVQAKMEYYAGRIKAAWKRQSVTGSHGLGNAAAMREALAALVRVIDECDSGSQLWWHSGAKGVIPLKNAKDALAAPPRNCDIYTTEDAVDTATVTVRDECGACPSLDMEAPCVFCMVRWLLAPAKKGGAK